MVTGECFESMDSFVHNSPDLMNEVTTYRFPFAATRPHMLAYLDEEMAKQRQLIAAGEQKPQVKEILIEEIKPLMLHHHHETTVLEDGSSATTSKQGWANRSDASRSHMLRNAPAPCSL